MTRDPRGFGRTSQSFSPFTLNLPPKPSCSLGAAVGTLCVSPDLLRQLVSTLISLRPQHVTDRIMSLNPAGGSRGRGGAADPDRALEQINVHMSKTMW